MVAAPPFFFIARTGEVVEELLSRDAGDFLGDLVLLELPCHARHSWNDGTDAVPEGPQRKIQISKNVLELKTVGVEEGALQDRLRHLKTYERMILLRSVSALRDLQHIKAELRPEV